MLESAGFAQVNEFNRVVFIGIIGLIAYPASVNLKSCPEILMSIRQIFSTILQQKLMLFGESTQIFSSRSLSAYFSRSISPRVRIPSQRNRGKGGHHPCNPCCKRNGKTMPGRNNHFRFLVKPSIRPERAKAEALTSSTRSISHSLSSI